MRPLRGLTMSDTGADDGGLEYTNYCAAFLDLLGQRDAMQGQGLLILDEDGEPDPAVLGSMKTSVLQTLSFQEDCEHFLNNDRELALPDDMSDQDKQTVYDIRRQGMKRQRWSDGLVLYACMKAIAPMNAIYEVMYASTCLCLQQLAKKAPIRGGIDISWGAELHDNELYGAIVANSYALESEIAQIPRIVVGDRLLHYLEVAIDQADESKVSDRINKSLAQFCQSILIRDLDGYVILDYLSDPIQQSMGVDIHDHLTVRALEYAHEQYEYFRTTSRSSKLASRYNWLISYLEKDRS